MHIILIIQNNCFHNVHLNFLVVNNRKYIEINKTFYEIYYV